MLQIPPTIADTGFRNLAEEIARPQIEFSGWPAFDRKLWSQPGTETLRQKKTAEKFFKVNGFDMRQTCDTRQHSRLVNVCSTGCSVDRTVSVGLTLQFAVGALGRRLFSMASRESLVFFLE